MKFTINWLKEFLDFNQPLEKVLSTLTNSGLEVEEVVNLGADLEGFTVAQIIDFTKHPDADKLNVCKVQTQNEVLQIVCGAPNVKKDMKVILAPLGATVPANGMKIKKVKIRGIESCGMMCSISELNLGDNHEGIVHVDEKFAIGTKAAEVFGLDDTLIELAITPNRGDCISVYGIARELAANNIGTLKALDLTAVPTEFESELKITNENPEIFKQFNIIEIRDVRNCPSPDWLKNRLESVGINAKSALVDITNYICLTFGQPMHSYDKAKIAGNFALGTAKGGEEFAGLDGKNYKLTDGDIVIKDAKKIIGLAGILGSDNSGSDLTTQNIYLEAAEFDHVALAKTGRKHQINSDARFRFERKIDSQNVVNCLNIAARLITNICGGKISKPVTIPAKLTEPQAIAIPYQKINSYLGLNIKADEIINILTRLNFTITNKTDISFSATAPSYRNDIALGIDIIEEVARIYGIDKIPEQKFSHAVVNTKIKSKPSHYNLRQRLVALGINELRNFPFTSTEDNQNFISDKTAIEIVNPINARENQLRTSLIGSLLKQISNSQKRNLEMNSFFEIGNICYKNSAGELVEQQHLATIRVGTDVTKQVNNNAREFDIFDSKNDLERIIETFNIASNKLNYTKATAAYLHPTKSFEITYANKTIGIIGELHPLLNKTYDISGRVQILELNLDDIKAQAKKPVTYVVNDLQKFSRDLAFVLADETAVGEVQKTIYKMAPELIQNIVISDVYKGDNIEVGHKSVAFNIIMQPLNDNMESQKIDELINRIIKQVELDFNCKLRA